GATDFASYYPHMYFLQAIYFFFSSRRRHTRSLRDWSSDVCSSDLTLRRLLAVQRRVRLTPVPGSCDRRRQRSDSRLDDQRRRNDLAAEAEAERQLQRWYGVQRRCREVQLAANPESGQRIGKRQRDG